MKIINSSKWLCMLALTILVSLSACKKEETASNNSTPANPSPSPTPTPTITPTSTAAIQCTGTFKYVNENNRTIQFAGRGAANFFGWGAVISANKKDLTLRFRYQVSQTEVYDIDCLVSSEADTITLGTYSFAGVNQTTPNYGLTFTSAYLYQGTQKLFSEIRQANTTTTPWNYGGNPIVKTGTIAITSITPTHIIGTLKGDMYADANFTATPVNYASKLIVDLSFNANYK